MLHSARSQVGWICAGATTFFIFSLALSWILVLPSPSWSFFWGGGTFKHANPDVTIAQSEFLDHVLNSTLGFGKILVINLPSSIEKRKALSEVAEASHIDLDWINGVLPDEIDKETLPPGKDGSSHSKLRGYSLGAWKAHMNALDHVIARNLSTAVIAEDDIDWDVRIKSQLRAAALGFQTMNQVFRFADVPPGPLDFSDMPPVEPPKTSPYGDEWDVLWLGLCRGHVDNNKASNPLVVRRSDPTVPEKKYIRTSEIDKPWTFLEKYSDHTRIYHHLRDGLCSLFYAVTLESARKIRHQFGDVMLSGPFDVMLWEYCNAGGRPGIGDKRQLRCLGVMPQLFNHWTPNAGNSRNIRWSARVNLQTLKAKNGTVAEDSDGSDWIDSYPDS